jgi:hypothetical protein
MRFLLSAGKETFITGYKKAAGKKPCQKAFLLRLVGEQ